MTGSLDRSRRLHRLGAACTAASAALFVAMQAVSGDWLPPEVSFSQYGVGPHGWIFSLFLVLFATAPLLVDRALPGPRVVRVLLLVGLVGCLVMALVRTDPGGLQHSLRAKIHMVGAALGLSGTPLGCAGLLWVHRRRLRTVTAALVVVSAAAIVLLLVTAAGVDTLGRGTVTSWAIWQTIAAVADVVISVLLVVAVRPGAVDSPPPTHRREERVSA